MVGLLGGLAIWVKCQVARATAPIDAAELVLHIDESPEPIASYTNRPALVTKSGWGDPLAILLTDEQWAVLVTWATNNGFKLTNLTVNVGERE
jgi:hypothetical protein